MYHGVQEVRFNIYVDKSNPLGWRYKRLHIYRCQHCGYQAAVLEKATEPFYCNCQRLMDITPSPSLEMQHVASNP